MKGGKKVRRGLEMSLCLWKSKDWKVVTYLCWSMMGYGEVGLAL